MQPEYAVDYVDALPLVVLSSFFCGGNNGWSFSHCSSVKSSTTIVLNYCF